MKNSKKTWYIAIIIIIVIAIMVTWFYQNKHNQAQNVPNQTSGTNAGNVTAKDITNTTQGDITISNVQFTSDGTLTNVTAQITNNGKVKYSLVDISIIFYDANKNVLATAKGLTENIDPGATKGFSSSISGDFSKSADYEIKIDSAK